MSERRDHLLLVSEDDEMRLRCGDALEKLDNRVTLAATIGNACEVLSNEHIDLLLIDAAIAVADGQGELPSLFSKASQQGIGSIVLADADEIGGVSRFIEMGATDYLIDPFNESLLGLRVQSNLDRRHLRQDQQAHLQNAELLKIEQDIQTARRIQAGFLPKTLPQLDGWEIEARFQPAREVAGDFYDAFTLSQKRRVGFVIADVVDKGVPAALFMALVRSLTRAFAQQHYSLSWTDALEGGVTRSRRNKGGSSSRGSRLPSTGTIALKNAVQLTNNYILENHLELNMFATLFFGMFDPTNGQLAYINAGHNPPFIVGADGTIKAKLTASGPAVGMFPGVDFQIDYGELEPGDILFAYTDGVTEARAPNQDFFKEERLLELLSEPALSAKEIVERVHEALNAFVADAVQFDDITMIAVRRKET